MAASDIVRIASLLRFISKGIKKICSEYTGAAPVSGFSSSNWDVTRAVLHLNAVSAELESLKTVAEDVVGPPVSQLATILDDLKTFSGEIQKIEPYFLEEKVRRKISSIFRSAEIKAKDEQKNTLCGALETLVPEDDPRRELCYYFTVTCLAEPGLTHPGKTCAQEWVDWVRFTTNPSEARFIFDLYDDCVRASGDYIKVVQALIAELDNWHLRGDDAEPNFCADFVAKLETHVELRESEEALFAILRTGTLAREVLDRAAKVHGKDGYDIIIAFMRESGVGIRNYNIVYRASTLRGELLHYAPGIEAFAEKIGKEILLAGTSKTPEEYEDEIIRLARAMLDEAGCGCVEAFMQKTGASILRCGPVTDGKDKHKYLKDLADCAEGRDAARRRK